MFALRFGHLRAENDENISEDMVRAAFNSPFRPFLLTSTSIGQEGLDFHPWCHRLVHWNLPGNPVIVAVHGRIFGPYTGQYFATTRQTDIEHIVAVSEAHDSGLCAADRVTRRQFPSDPLNLTLAAPAVNRCTASANVPWMPPNGFLR